MPVHCRAETPADRSAVRRVHEAAFGRPEEGRLVDALRASGCPLVALVAERAGEVVGHIVFSPVTLEAPAGSAGGVGLGPMAVLPLHQRQGIGSALVQSGLDACRRHGHRLVVVLGHPGFYPRFGFVPASSHGLLSEYPGAGEAFMVLELEPGALRGRRGLVRYRPEFATV